MKRFLYEIYDGSLPVYGIPAMPRVFAEKTARTMRRDSQREHPEYRFPHKYTVHKTPWQTRYGTPRGQRSWEEWHQKTFGNDD